MKTPEYAVKYSTYANTVALIWSFPGSLFSILLTNDNDSNVMGTEEMTCHGDRGIDMIFHFTGLVERGSG